MSEVETPPASPRLTVKRLIPVLVLIAGFVVFFALGLNRYVSFETLREHRQTLLDWVESSGALAVLTYMGVYTAAIAFSVPGGAVLSITGGFLFGAIWGMLYIVISATIGATAVFLIAKTSLGDPLRARAGPWRHRMEAGFRKNALNYLLVLRLVPLFPFFVVNLVPAFLGVSLPTYVLGTFVGIIPGSFVYASVGAGIGSIFDAGKQFTPGDVITPQVLAALIGLAVLALLPVVYKTIKARAS